MKHILIILISIFISANMLHAQRPIAKTVQDEIIRLETAFAEAIKSRDTVQTKKFQWETYFLAVGIRGKPLQIIPRQYWLSNLKNYIVESYSIDDIKVNVYGKTAVALLLYTQNATSGGQDRSAQFVLTDIWVKKGKKWLIAERHSSRPEGPVTK